MKNTRFIYICGWNLKIVLRKDASPVLKTVSQGSYHKELKKVHPEVASIVKRMITKSNDIEPICDIEAVWSVHQM